MVNMKDMQDDSKNIYSAKFVVILSLALITIGCHQPLIPVQSPAPEVKLSAIVQPKLSLKMPDTLNAYVYGGVSNQQMVFQFYNSNQFKLIWFNDSLPGLADSLKHFIRSVRFHGLLAKDYHYTELERLDKELTAEILIYRKDVLLTDAFFLLASDLKYGRLGKSIKPANADSLMFGVLNQAIERNEICKMLETLEPDRREYQSLKASLREILNAVDSSSRTILLSGITFDMDEVHKNVQLLEVNMERWRTEVSFPADRYIRVNIPSYYLQVFERDQVVLESKTIVGKHETATPTFSSLVECITLYPYWHVPRSISVNEYLPAIKKDTSFLTKNNFDVLDRKGNVINRDSLDWHKYHKNNFPFTLRQREGKENSLGVIKFVFDNPYSVFLHDTNAKRLFSKPKRSLSHGCIRVEKAIELTKYLVPKPEIIDKQLALKERWTINLTKPVPIHIRYFTCANVNGVLEFYDDIYHLDSEIVRKLYTDIR